MDACTLPPIVIRGFRREDLRRLHEIDAVCFDGGIAYTRAEISFYIRRSRSVALVAECGGEIAGFAIGRLEGECGHVITIDVLPEARRRGVGRELLTELHRAFRDAGAGHAILEVDIGNGPAHAFYEGFGYRRMEILRGYYGSGRDAYRMVSRIDRPFRAGL